jgi:NADP-dependent 3-hydroxy acid dehydrogenase YdfG
VSLAGRSAWITGAGSGIGRAIAIAFAQAGARVALTGRREAPLRETAALIGGGEVIAADLTDAAAVTQAAARVAGTIGGPDILVNNAGVNTPRRYTHQLDAATIRALVDGNLTAPFLTSTAVLPAMRARGGGLLIQVASMAGKNVSFLSGPGYTAAKHGFVALSQAINQENGIHGIRSSCICPGEVATDILKNRPEPVPPEELARMLQAEDIARIALFLATTPAHVAITEVLVQPAWMRLLAPQARRISELP